MAYLDHIQACNRWNPGDYWRLYRGTEGLGRVRRELAPVLAAWPDLFVMRTEGLEVLGQGLDFAELTARFAEVVEVLCQQGWLPRLHGESYPVTASQREQARWLVDRASAPLFGIRAFGQHLNGYVRRADGIHLWIAKRAAHRINFPSRLDNLVAGGLPYGLTLADNLRKECHEEAGMPAALAAQARPVGVLSYCGASSKGLKPDVLYCYDLELPEDFAPSCQDDEVESFQLLPLGEVAEIIDRTEAFKLNCNLVVTDFLIRHGYLGPDHPDYLAINQGLRSRLPE